MEVSVDKKDNKFLIVIGVVSVLIPVVVAVLLFIPNVAKVGNYNVSFIPHINAALNSATSLCLIAGYIAIRNKNISLHRAVMVLAFVLSSVFLVCYVIYHSQGTSTKFGDVDHNGIVTAAEVAAVGAVRYAYFALLLTHIVLAAIVVPFVLLAFYFALSGQIERHKKIVKWTYPIWLYVAISGVLVYLMISPYYA